MGELGILFTQEALSPWKFEEADLVGQGVVALANRIGSFKQLRSLLGFGFLLVLFHRATVSVAPANTIPGTTMVLFTDSLFRGPEDYVRGTAVHELAHVIDYFGGVGGSPIGYGGQWQRGAMVPKDTFVSTYGMNNNFGLEYWAEAMTDWVYGSRYNGPYARGVREALTTSQSDWISRVLKGWGWG